MEFWFMAVSVVLLALCIAFMCWLMKLTKKLGIKPGPFQKAFYDNVTSTWDSRIGRHHRTGYHRSWYYSKKGGKHLIEITHTRGTLYLEYYTEDGEVIQSWKPGDPLTFTLDIPPKKKVYHRSRMTHFSGSICERRKTS